MNQDGSQLFETNLNIAEEAARAALADACQEWGRPELNSIASDGDLFERIDSFAVVELLLLTETKVEAIKGRYVPLANEKLLDAEASPLRRFSAWVAYLAEAMTDG